VGSEIHLLGAGLLSWGVLEPLKARIRLVFGLSADIAPDRLFRRAGQPLS
jgi:hypothetical protein